MRVGKVRLRVVAIAGTQQQMPQCSQVSNRLNATHGNCMKVWAHKQEDAATIEFASLGSLGEMGMALELWEEARRGGCAEAALTLEICQAEIGEPATPKTHAVPSLSVGDRAQIGR